jgi:diguanylate cyclase (GGDEF)-like protein/PAS domain S-box-containing protein
MAPKRFPQPAGALPTVDSLDAIIAAHEGLRRFVERMASDQSQWNEERIWLRALIDQVPDYLFVKDIECRFVVANNAVAADLGHGDPNMLIGKTDLDLHPPELAEAFIANDRRVMDSGKPMLDHEEFVVLGDGTKRWLSTSKLPLRTSDGTIIGLVGIARDITERKGAEDRIHHLAYHDALTGLPNRMQFEIELQAAVQAATEDALAVLILIDLDRFKHVNDTLGHVAGDELIRQVARRLLALVGKRGTVARLGGDEFAVLLTGVGNPHLAEGMSNAIISELARQFDLLGDPAFIGGSLGIGTGRPGTSADQVLREADIALYDAKSRGRGRWQVFMPAMATALEERRVVERDLRDALGRGGQLHLEYQPIFAADGITLAGAEALVRWNHPVRGRLAPDLFVGVAEERGLIDKMGEWVFDEACRMLLDTDIPWVAVNVSPVQLSRRRFFDRALATIADMKIDPSRVQLEITEGVLLEATESTEAGLRRLRAAGVRLALDDFGTGYSSLSYLRRYNVDKLKVDRSFVAQLGMSSDAAVIVHTIVGLARAMGMQVTAEGVETELQREFLVSCGCQELQGYLFSRPLPLQTLQALYAGQTAKPSRVSHVRSSTPIRRTSR